MKGPTDSTVESIIARVAELGYADVTPEIVREFVQWGSVPESNVGSDYDEALEEALLTACDEHGIEI